MNKIFITIVLFLLALTVVANNPLYDYIKQNPGDPAEGMSAPKTVALSDFNTLLTEPAPNTTALKAYDPLVVPPLTSNQWYNYDFSEAPFDGMLEMAIIGEPLPTPMLTLLAAFGTAGIIVMNKKRNRLKG